MNAVIDHIADHPSGPVGRLAARRYGRAVHGTPAVRFDRKPFRVLITPVNYSGQGRAWAAALEAADPRISARNVAIQVPGGFEYESDVVVPVSSYHNDRDWQRRQFEAARSATHVLIEAEEPPFGRLMRRDVRTQAGALRSAGVEVAFIAHGTDVRLPSRNLERTPWSYYADPGVYVPRLEALAARNAQLLTSSGCPIFVSTPDLLADLPDAVWCPVAIDTQAWRVEDRDAPSNRLRVIHTPSSPVAKGTPLIERAIAPLVSSGTIDYRRVTGVASAQMPSEYRAADVLLDQFRVGGYGVAAVEAMAAGCVVVGHVLPDVRRHIRAETGLDLPIVEATPDTLPSVLTHLVDHPGQLLEVAARGPRFVKQVHDGRLSAAALIGGWISPSRSRKAPS